MQLLDLVARESGGGLVQDEHARLERQSPRDGHQVLLRHTERSERCLHVEVRLQRAQAGPRALAHPAPVEPAAATGGEVAREQVLRHRQLVEQRRILIDGCDAVLQRVLCAGQRHRRAAHQQGARIGPAHASHQLDRGGLAGAILPEQRQHLALDQRQAHAGQRQYPAEALVHLRQRQRRGRSRARDGPAARRQLPEGLLGHGKVQKSLAN